MLGGDLAWVKRDITDYAVAGTTLGPSQEPTCLQGHDWSAGHGRHWHHRWRLLLLVAIISPAEARDNRLELRGHCKFCRPESRAGFACILACQSFVSGTRMYFIGFEFIFLFFPIFNGLLRLLDGKDPGIEHLCHHCFIPDS